jgi:hypothetical protein
MKKQIVAFITAHLVMAGAGTGTAFLLRGAVEAGPDVAAENAPTEFMGTLLGESFSKNPLQHSVDDVDGTALAAVYVNAADDERAPLLAMVSAPTGNVGTDCGREGCLDVGSLWNEYTHVVGLASSAAAHAAGNAEEPRSRSPQEFGYSNGITSGGTQVLGNGNAGAPGNSGDNGSNGSNGSAGGAPGNGAGTSPDGRPSDNNSTDSSQPVKSPPENDAGPGKGPDAPPVNVPDGGPPGKGPDTPPVNAPDGGAPGKGPDTPPVNVPDGGPPGKGPDGIPVKVPDDLPVNAPVGGIGSDVNVVPEPGSLALLLLGMVGLAVARGRRKDQV